MRLDYKNDIVKNRNTNETVSQSLDQLTEFAGLIGNIADELCLILFGEFVCK